MKLDTHELAWAAGFFDGEGYVGLLHNRANGRVYGKPHIRVSQVDRVVLDRFRSAAGALGAVRGPYGYRDARRPQWQYTVSAWRDVQAVCALLWKYLSPVKRAQFARTLRAYGASRLGKQHRLSESDVRTIRAQYGPGMGYVRLGRRFGVTPSAIRSVVKRRTWAHLPSLTGSPTR